MANIAIWPGSSSFFPGDTPFEFYDTDLTFQTDADKVANWCAKRLGYPLVDIELQSINFYACFEEAVTEYGTQVYQYEIIENFHTLEGNETGSALNQQVISPNLGHTIEIGEGYGTEAGSGGSIKYKTGSIKISQSIQNYDLYDLFASGTEAGNAIEIKRLHHKPPPAIVRYFDPYAGTGTGIQSLMQSFGFGNYSPGVNFMLMPIYFDVLKLQAIELNDQIRKSGYSFELYDNRMLRLFPIPTRNYTLYFDYVVKKDRNAAVRDTNPGLISDMSNVPYNLPTYEYINAIGKQWIRRYALALAKEMLGSIRGKYASVPIPGDSVILDFSRLLSEASEEKKSLIEELRSDLQETSRVKQLERQHQEADFTEKIFFKVPYPIYIY